MAHKHKHSIYSNQQTYSYVNEINELLYGNYEHNLPSNIYNHTRKSMIEMSKRKTSENGILSRYYHKYIQGKSKYLLKFIVLRI